MTDIAFTWMDWGAITLCSGFIAVASLMYVLFKFESKPNKRK